jgi:DNA-binding NarL/FixJ family response regulator
MADARISLLIVEDQPLFRDLLRKSLENQPNLKVLDAVADGETAVSRAHKLKPDVVLMDIDLGKGLNGLQAGMRIRAENPKTGIVVLSMHQEKELLSVVPMEQRSGWSYLLKQSVSDLSALTRAIEGSASGLVVLDPDLITALHPNPKSRLAGMNARQREVLELMAQGYDNGAIAAKINVAEKSVENYINAIYQQLGVSGEEDVHPRMKAVLLYLEQSRHKKV